MTDSMFNRGGSGKTRGGLDRFLGPRGQGYSKAPEALTDGKAAPDDPTEADVDCEGKDAQEPVCRIKRAVDEAAHPAPGREDRSPGE